MANLDPLKQTEQDVRVSRRATFRRFEHYTWQKAQSVLPMSNHALTMSLEAKPAPLEDERSQVSAARKDPEAAGQLFDKYYPEIFRYIYHSTLNHAVTEDLTSNVFFSAFRHLPFFRWRRVPFRAWLYRIATNEIRMHYRRQKRSLATLGGPLAPDPAYDTASVDAEVALSDDYRLLHSALLQLGEKYRAVIVLRFFEDKSLSNISEITNKREGTIKSLLHRGLAQLREVLVREGVSLP